MKKQVEREHYFNEDYLDKERFLSYYYQIHPILKIKPRSVLEIGPGNGIVTNMLKGQGIDVTTIDIAKDLKPDKIGSVTELTKFFKESSFDMILCAEILEHLPFEKFDKSLEEMSKVTKKHVIISLPYSGMGFGINIKIPLFSSKSFKIKIPLFKIHKFNGEHYWEIGKRGYSLKDIVKHIEKYFIIQKRFNPSDDLFHIFFILEKK